MNAFLMAAPRPCAVLVSAILAHTTGKVIPSAANFLRCLISNIPFRFSASYRAHFSRMRGISCRRRKNRALTTCATRWARGCVTNYQSVRSGSITESIPILMKTKISVHSISVLDLLSDLHVLAAAAEMKDRQLDLRGDAGDLGDISPAIFREQLHRLADWIADYREKIETLPVEPDAKPGAITGALPKQAPEEGEHFETIFADIKRLIVPGMVHWDHPMFLGYFGWTTTAPGILGEIITSPLNVNAMTWRTSPAATELETLVVDWLRQWMQLP